MFELLKDDVLSAWSRDHHGLAIAEDPRARRVSALMFAAVAVVYPAWHWIFLHAMPAARDPLGERLLVSAIMIVAIACFRVRALRRHMPIVEHVLLFGLTGHYLSMVWRNDMALPYMIATFVVLACVSVVITRLLVAIAYFVFSLVVTGVMMRLSRHPSGLELEFFVGMASLLMAITLGIYRVSVLRQIALTRISQGRRMMKQIIETIPDPIFVRTAERRLVLTNEAGRKFENATGYHFADVVQKQEDESLAARRTLEADAEISTGAGPISVSVKTAATVLPGNHMMLVTVMRDVTDRRALEESLRRRLHELEEARARVRQLQGMLPICMHCNQIRIAEGKWERLDHYVAEHSNARFTHTLCASCLEEHYPAA